MSHVNIFAWLADMAGVVFVGLPVQQDVSGRQRRSNRLWCNLELLTIAYLVRAKTDSPPGLTLGLAQARP